MKYWKYVIAGIGFGFLLSGGAAIFMLNDDGTFGTLLIQVGTIFQVIFAGIAIGGSGNLKSTK